MQTSTRVSLVASCLAVVLASCGGGGGADPAATNTAAPGGSTGSGGTGGGAASGFSIQYTHTAEIDGSALIPNMNFFYDWFVENADGSMRGPFESDGAGRVDLGAESRARVNVTRSLSTAFNYTYMDVPVGQRSYYNGMHRASPDGRVTVSGQGASGQVRLGHDLLGWHNVTADPFAVPQQINMLELVIGNDNLSSMFVSLRAAESEEPLSRYAYRLDFPSTELRTLTVNMASPRTRTSRGWQSTRQTLGSPPCVVAERKGQFHRDIGGAAPQVGVVSAGTIGVPEQFPADRWYLADSCFFLNVVAQFNPADSAPIALRHSDRSIVSQSFVFDAAQRTLSFQLAAGGSDRIDYGAVELHQGGTLSWIVYFPASALVTATDGSGRTTLRLPSLPRHASLPAFDFVSLTLYRFDSTITSDDFLTFLLNGKNNPMPSHATTTGFQMSL